MAELPKGRSFRKAESCLEALVMSRPDSQDARELNQDSAHPSWTISTQNHPNGSPLNLSHNQYLCQVMCIPFAKAFPGHRHRKRPTALSKVWRTFHFWETFSSPSCIWRLETQPRLLNTPSLSPRIVSCCGVWTPGFKHHSWHGPLMQDETYAYGKAPLLLAAIISVCVFALS